MILDFAIAFGHPAIDSTVQHAVVDLGLETYEQAVSRARTFGFVSEVELLRSMGLAKGGTLENAIVMDEYRVLNVGGLRSDDEFVKHKILDAMGDLYVLGHPLLARYVAYKSGHALNNRLLRALLAETDAWEIAEVKAAQRPLRRMMRQWRFRCADRCWLFQAHWQAKLTHLSKPRVSCSRLFCE